MTNVTSENEAAPPVASDEAPERPKPTFDVLPLSAELRETLVELEYFHPTPVQIAVWDPATRRCDAVVQARTGTGKTASFGIPIVDNIVKKSLHAPQVLALCPTRELALQVAAEIERLGKRKNVKVIAIYGGAPMPRQVSAIADGAQIVVGTPGRVLDHIRRGTLPTKNVRLLVLDESDEMLSMGFERELTAILEELPSDRQTLLFSATVPPDIERIAKNKLRNPEFITLSGDHIGALEIEHYVYMIATDKRKALIRMLEVENPDSAVIFCNTKDETEAVAQALRTKGYDADWLNGDLAQSERERVMTRTRNQTLRFLVATDVAARGIDVSHLTHVINFDFPQDAESYVHRTGRTGRAGRTGTAISLIAPQDIGRLYLLRLTYRIRPIERQLPSQGELKTRAEADVIAMLAEAFGPNVHPDDVSLARRLLTHEQGEIILGGLLRDYLGARPAAREDASQARRKRRRPLPDAVATPEPSREAERPQRSRDQRPRASDAEKASEPRGRRSDADRPRQNPSGENKASGSAPQKTPVSMERSQPATTSENGDASRDSNATGDGDASRPRRRRDRARPDNRVEGRTEDRGRTPAEPAMPVPRRQADYANWSPPEEEGDDQPILGGQDRSRTGTRVSPLAPSAPKESARSPRPDDASLVDIFLNVGRRDGARAAELTRLIIERADVPREHVQRVRVRDRHTFVSVHRDVVDKTIAALTGTEQNGRTLKAEVSRDRSQGDGGSRTKTDRIEGISGDKQTPDADRQGDGSIPTDRSRQ